MSNTLLPEYKTILEEIGVQLRLRKGLLLKRTLLLVWPGILILLFGYYVDMTIGIAQIQENIAIGNVAAIPILVLITFGVLLLFAIIYGVIVNFIFEIEKQIWIDSYFDKKNLEPAVSWRIATSLFWSALWMRVSIFFTYYFFQILAIWVVAAVAQFLLITKMPIVSVWHFLPIPVALIAVFIYSYYTRIALRYTWFIFLDRYSPQLTFMTIIDEMKKLNAVARTEAFKKSLLSTIGVDSVGGLTSAALGAITTGMGSAVSGKFGELLGQVTRLYGQVYIKQATDLSHIAAQYILYRHVVREVYGEHQIVNEALYQL